MLIYIYTYVYCRYRGRLARRRVNGMRRERHERDERDAAARRIQAVHRGNRGRQAAQRRHEAAMAKAKEDAARRVEAVEIELQQRREQQARIYVCMDALMLR